MTFPNLFGFPFRMNSTHCGWHADADSSCAAGARVLDLPAMTRAFGTGTNTRGPCLPLLLITKVRRQAPVPSLPLRRLTRVLRGDCEPQILSSQNSIGTFERADREDRADSAVECWNLVLQLYAGHCVTSVLRMRSLLLLLNNEIFCCCC